MVGRASFTGANSRFSHVRYDCVSRRHITRTYVHTRANIRGCTRCKNAYGDDIRHGEIRFGCWPRARQSIVIAKYTADINAFRFVMFCPRALLGVYICTGCRKSRDRYVNRVQRLDRRDYNVEMCR